MWFSCFPVLTGSAEAQVIWDGIVKHIFNAYFISNISAKKMKIHSCASKLYQAKGGTFFETQCSGRQTKFAALNRGRHLYSAGRSSRWALAHILVNYYFSTNLLPSPLVKEFLKSINSWQTYSKTKKVQFLTHSVECKCQYVRVHLEQLVGILSSTG